MGRKRPRAQAVGNDEPAGITGVGDTLKHLNAQSAQDSQESNPDTWTTVPKNKKPKLDPDANTYPAVYHANHVNLSSRVKLKDLQDLILYITVDSNSPKWIAVRNAKGIRKVVALTVPGLEPGMFDGSTALGVDENGASTQDDAASKWSSPDGYYPVKLDGDSLDASLKPLATIFPYMYPVDTGGDKTYTRISSPLHTILNVALERLPEEQKKKGPQTPRYAKNWKNQPTPVTNFFATIEEMVEDDYTLHACQNPSQTLKDRWSSQKRTAEHGWVQTDMSKAPTEHASGDPLTVDWQVLAIDCEMCQTEESQFDLTRISIIDWKGQTIMDELVKPASPVTNYVTQFSGITKEMLDPVTTSLSDIQAKLLDLIDSKTVLLGHSLVSDLTALKLVHPHVIDTSILFPHPRGPPLKSALKFLSQKYLNREIRKSGYGHNPVEDALAALNLVQQKCQKGPEWATSQANEESLFTRLGRAQRRGGAPSDKAFTGIVDWGTPERGHGHGAGATIGCDNDDAVVKGIVGLVTGDHAAGPNVPTRGADFVWGRFRELEAKRGWWTQGRSDDNEAARINARGDGVPDQGAALGSAVAKTVQKIAAIWDKLPPATVFIVYSGTGDVRELKRLNDMHKQYKEEFQTKKWDELSVQWTDEEERARDKAAKKARSGVGFVVVK